MKTHVFLGFLFVFALFSCNGDKPSENPVTEEKEYPRQLSFKEAQRIVKLPLQCIDQEYPNKLNQVIDGDSDLRSPDELHPAFYGCFDWHSAVHGHWSLVKLAKAHPELVELESILNGLNSHINPINIEGELEYFEHKHSQGFERMYGWAWLLKLAEELHTWDHSDARQLEKNLQPLTDLIAEKVIKFLPKLHYPIRVGTHTNTAFALSMIYDYADAVNDKELKSVVVEQAKTYYLSDENCPITWEPSGYDFLSPCLEEADIMRRILPKDEFKIWLNKFLPGISDSAFELKPGIVSDRTDGHLVHLDGLNYSRAWCLYGIAETLPEYNHLITVANAHIDHSLPDLTDGHYEGGHWLASFALMALR
jgi:hypothetical protein